MWYLRGSDRRQSMRPLQSKGSAVNVGWREINPCHSSVQELLRQSLVCVWVLWAGLPQTEWHQEANKWQVAVEFALDIYLLKKSQNYFFKNHCEIPDRISTIVNSFLNKIYLKSVCEGAPSSVMRTRGSISDRWFFVRYEAACSEYLCSPRLQRCEFSTIYCFCCLVSGNCVLGSNGCGLEGPGCCLWWCFFTESLYLICEK